MTYATAGFHWKARERGAWPVVARGQQTAVPVVGFLGSASNAPPGPEPTPKGFRAGLNEAGHFVGRNDDRIQAGQFSTLN